MGPPPNLKRKSATTSVWSHNLLIGRCGLSCFNGEYPEFLVIRQSGYVDCRVVPILRRVGRPMWDQNQKTPCDNMVYLYVEKFKLRLITPTQLRFVTLFENLPPARGDVLSEPSPN